ncbi:MAG: M1 family metallopeptidase [Clostridia bacterium]|nr:M1 family metallopeptidase [Clostridia bacterium]
MKLKSLALAFILLTCSLLTFGCGKKESAKISEYEIVGELNGNTLTATQKFTYFNNTETAINELKFNLYGNAFRNGAKYSPVDSKYHHQCYYDGVNFGGMEISAVRNIDGAPLEYSVCGEDLNILSVVLEKEVYPEESVKIEIDFSLTLAKIIARTGITSVSINLANFYPVLCARDESGFYECNYYSLGDPFFSDIANYNVELTVDAEYVVAGAGERVNVSEENGKKCVQYCLEKGRSYAMVLSKNFEAITKTELGVEITYYFYQDDFPQQSLDTAIKALQLFSNKFGKYPYSTYTVVQTPFNEGGMEYASLTYIAGGLEKEVHQEVIVHETAHQWWQSVVGNNEIEYGFLDEGLAEYSVVIFYENYPEYNMKRESLVKQGEDTYHAFSSVFDKLYGKVNTAMLRPLKDYSGAYEYVNIAYIKGFLMHEYLRQTIGDELYFKGLKRYYNDYSYKNATPYDLVGAFEKSGANSNGFFESFFNGSVII